MEEDREERAARVVAKSSKAKGKEKEVGMIEIEEEQLP